MRKQNIKRFSLPLLEANDRNKFLNEFDQFWDKVISPFDKNHPFWRNIISSKMQEWENSAAYLALILFTISCLPPESVSRLLILTSCLEEEQVWRMWARKQGWVVVEHRRYFPEWISKIAQELLNVLRFAYYAILVFRNKLLFPSEPLPPKDQTATDCTLIVSLSYPWSFRENRYQDPFFGDVHRLFKQYKRKCLYLSDLLAVPDSTIVKAVSDCNDVKVFSPYAILSLRELFMALGEAFGGRIKFSVNDFMGCNFSKLLEWNSRRFLYHLNIHAQMYFYAVMKLCQRYNLIYFLCIFEGNVFERACIQAFRRYSNGHIAGYSHAPIYELNLKLRLTEHEMQNRPEADWYICPGPYAKKMLAHIGGRPVTKLKVACTLKDLPFLASEQDKERPSDTVLVGLDGFLTSVCLLDWLMEHEDCFRGFKVLIREHPNVPVNKLLQRCIHPLPPSFEIAGNLSLAECIQRSFCVLYRQTSIGMQALLNGIPAVHLAVDTPLSADPMEELRVWKWVARNSDELSAALWQIRLWDSADRMELQEQAKNFAKEFFSMPTGETLKEFIGV